MRLPSRHGVYATLRNSVEGMNGLIKDGAHEAVDDPERRRIRGLAAQSVLLSFQLFAANLRKIEEFLKARAKAIKGKVRKLPPCRRTKSLASWAPTTSTAVGATTGDATDDPDPPLTA